MSPKVSVIIPNYNHSKYLKKRIESVLSQNYPDFEVILMDDCSPDNSAEILQSYASHPKVSQLLLNTENSGSTFKQWDKGIQAAQGELIWIAESDDWAHTDFLEELLPHFQEKQVGLSFCQSVRVDEKGEVLGEWSYSKTEAFSKEKNYFSGLNFIQHHLSSANSIPNASAVVFRKSLYEKVGGADPSFKINGDWLFWVKIAELADVVYLNKPLNYFRFHSNNVRSKVKIRQSLKEYLLIVHKVSQTISFNKEEKKLHMYSVLHFIFRLWFFKLSLKEQYALYQKLKKIDSGILYKMLRVRVAMLFQ